MVLLIWALPAHTNFGDPDLFQGQRRVKQFQLKILCFHPGKLKLHWIVKYVK